MYVFAGTPANSTIGSTISLISVNENNTAAASAVDFAPSLLPVVEGGSVHGQEVAAVQLESGATANSSTPSLPPRVEGSSVQDVAPVQLENGAAATTTVDVATLPTLQAEEVNAVQQHVTTAAVSTEP